MYSAWNGGSNSALSSNVNGTANFHGITGAFSGGWNTTNANRQCPVSEAITVVGLYVFCDTDPTPGNLTFALDVAGAASAATCTMAAGTTSASFTGSVAVAQDALLSLRCTPNASAAVQTNIYWIIEYSTTGNFFCYWSGSSTTYAAAANNFWVPQGFNGSALGTTAPQRMTLCPDSGTLTRFSVASPVGAVGGTSYACSVRTNDTTDNLTATMTTAQTAATATGTIAVAAGDSLTIKGVPVGTPTVRRLGFCITIAPDKPDQSWAGFGGDQNILSDNTSRYENPSGIGSNGWSTTESARLFKTRGYYYSRLYWALVTAPGGVATRTLTMRNASAGTALTSTITGAGTTGNDILDRILVASSGTTFDLESAAAGTPAAVAGLRAGWAFEVVPQIYGPPWKRPTNRPFSQTAVHLCDL